MDVRKVSHRSSQAPRNENLAVPANKSLQSTASSQGALGNEPGMQPVMRRGALADRSNINGSNAQPTAHIKAEQGIHAAGNTREDARNPPTAKPEATQNNLLAPLQTRGLENQRVASATSKIIHDSRQSQEQSNRIQMYAQAYTQLRDQVYTDANIAEGAEAFADHQQPRRHESQPGRLASDALLANSSNSVALSNRERADYGHLRGYSREQGDQQTDSDDSYDGISPSENWATFGPDEEPHAPQLEDDVMHSLPAPVFTTSINQEIEAAQQIYCWTTPQQEIEDDYLDPLMVAEYAEEIFTFMRERELEMLPKPDYMRTVQTFLAPTSRRELMEWVVLQHTRLNLLPESLFLAVNYIDRFLSSKVISPARLQLVGATAILLASKYEEIQAPSLQDLEHTVESRFSIEEIICGERYMLTILEYELGFPCPLSFLRLINKADAYDSETRLMSKYFLEATIMDERFVGSPPSFLAAASQCLAKLVLGKGDWSPQHVSLSGYTYAQLLPALEVLVSVCRDPTRHHYYVWTKYATKRFQAVSHWVHRALSQFWLPPSQPSPFEYLELARDGVDEAGRPKLVYRLRG